MARFMKIDNKLKYQFDAEKLLIEPWGENSFRIRAIKQSEFPSDNGALLDLPKYEVQIEIGENYSTITNGKIKAKITKNGKLTIYNQKNEILLDEYWRNQKDLTVDYCSALEIEGREFKPILGGDYSLKLRLETTKDEKIFGMGQYQQPYLDLKGNDLELAHRNSQASIPFALSSKGYGFLWNNPAIGRVIFGKNITTWEAYSTKSLDYWITAGDTPAKIEEAYANATGKVPEMPEYALGFWQCKLRYQNQEELLSVAREYVKRKIPLSVIVVDFFHWPTQGDFRFDPVYWPDPDAMIKELKELGIELMVSVWPNVDHKSENFAEMEEKGLLVRMDRGVRVAMTFQGNTIHADFTNPETCEYIWAKIKKNYYDKGIKIFWLDESEPEYNIYDFDNFRYHSGNNLQTGNIYPKMYAKAFYEGMEKEGQTNIINLIRCAWAGSQKYGTLVWSGDIHSSFESLKNQVVAGLSMAIAGIPWWTTDIGGFSGGDVESDDFKELLIRWFQYGTFLPVMRLHGHRKPYKPQQGTTGGATCCSGADNEIWSYGNKVYEICKKYIEIRENLKPYIKNCMKEASEKGTPVIRPLFYDFSNDIHSWEIEDEYMFGSSILVAPILENKATKRKVYLPKGTKWTNVWSGHLFEGGKEYIIDAPIEQIPLFIKYGDNIKIY